MVYLYRGNEEGIDYPQHFYSNKLNTHQKKYSTVEKYTLAFIWLVYETFSLFHVEVFTDFFTTPHFPVQNEKQESTLDQVELISQRVQSECETYSW